MAAPELTVPEIVPELGLMARPGGRPVAVKVTVLVGRSPSEAEVESEISFPSVEDWSAIGFCTGGVLTSVTVIVTDSVSASEPSDTTT